MRAAAAMMKLPIGEVKRAKNGGCTAFVGQKVYRDRLIAWLKKNPPAVRTGGGTDVDREELERRKLIRLVERLDIGIQSDRLKLEKEQGTLVEVALVKEEWARLWAMIEGETKELMDKAIFPVWVARVKAKIK